jgi:hypothetical protein
VKHSQGFLLCSCIFLSESLAGQPVRLWALACVWLVAFLMQSVAEFVFAKEEAAKGARQ